MSCPAGAVPGLPLDATRYRSFCVNRWQPITVMSSMLGSIPAPVPIGTIAVNDYFRYEWVRYPSVSGQVMEYLVMIKNSSGVLEWGFINGTAAIDANIATICTPIENVFLSQQAWNGMTLRTHTIQNRPAVLRNQAGAIIETLPVGTTVAIRAGIAASMGQTWCTYWQITAVLRMVSPVLAQWQWADHAGSTWGFVDTGLPFNRPDTSTIRTSLA